MRKSGVRLVVLPGAPGRMADTPLAHGASGGMDERTFMGPTAQYLLGRACGPEGPHHLPPRQALDLDSIHSHHWCIQGCSAVTGQNLLPGIDWLLDDISSRIFTAD